MLNTSLFRKIVSRIKKNIIKYFAVPLLLSSSVVLAGCNTTESKESSVAGNQSETIETKEQANATVSPTESAQSSIPGETTESSLPGESDVPNDSDIPAKSNDSSSDTSVPSITVGSVLYELVRDIDGNGIDDSLQVVSLDDEGINNCLHVFLNGEKIFEYAIEDLRFMGPDAFEYLDLDEDNSNEIFITAYTNTNSRPYEELLCLKQIDGEWHRMYLPKNEHNLNGFAFKITRGKDEFDFIISSDDTDQIVHFDASIYFVDDADNSRDSIQAYRNNNYKEGDEVAFISAWGIHNAITGSFQGRNCIIATHGIEGPYGHGLGRIDVYFAYNGQGELEILNIEHIVEY